jgi:hypothetical protein
MLYVTLGNPVAWTWSAAAPAAVAVPYFTLLTISCQHANGDNAPNAVVDHIFDAFSALDPNTAVNNNFQRKRQGVGSVFTYWNPQPGAGQDLLEMLTNVQHSGACGAWSDIFVCMAALHGIGNLNTVKVKRNPGISGIANGFLVRNWTFHAPPAAAGGAYTHNYTPGGPPATGDATWGPGLVGQNSTNPPPAFWNHYIVYHATTGNFFDPSYGSGPHPTWQGWVTAAVGGLRTNVPPPMRAGFALAAGAPLNSVRLRDLITNAFLN